MAKIGVIQDIIEMTKLEYIRSDLVAFAEYVMKDENGKPWKVPNFHKEIYQQLMAMVNHVVKMKNLSNRTKEDISFKRNLLLMAPREHGKTSMMIAFILWVLGNYPSMRIKYVSMSDTHSKNVLMQIKRNIEKNKNLKKVFPNLKPADGGRWSAFDIDVAKVDVYGEWDESELGIKDASLSALGITSAATGGRADIVIFDDIIGSRSAIIEPGRMEVIKRVFYQDWLNIGRYCNIVIGTPWTPDDIYAELSRSSEWIVWKRPAIDNNGNPLWPERWPIEELMKKKSASETNFALMFMLQGVKDKILWWTEHIIEKCKDRSVALGEIPFDPKGIVIGLDPAVGRRSENSYSCITVLAYDAFKRRCIVDIKRMRAQPRDVAEEVVNLYLREYPKGASVSCVMVENNATQEAFIDLIDTIAKFKNQSINIPLIGQFTGGNKWNPEIGLPRLVTNMENGLYIFPFKHPQHKEKIDPLHECPICQLINEMLKYPYETDSTDMIMSLWLADCAVENKTAIGELHSVGSSTSVPVRWF